jgi:hypothetical protein
MLSVVRDATGAMTTDTGLDQTTMLQIASSLRGLRSSSVQFVTAPNVAYPPDPGAEVEFAQPQASQLFSAIAHDVKLPKAKKAKRGRKPRSAHATTTPVLDTAPSKVKVQVQNGSGANMLATKVGADLTSRGFAVVGTGDASNFNYTSSVIEYAASADLPAANTLKAYFSNVQVVQNAALTPGTVTLIVGSTFSALKSPSSASATASAPSVSSLGASDHAITANIGICKNQAAFASTNGG